MTARDYPWMRPEEAIKMSYGVALHHDSVGLPHYVIDDVVGDAMLGLVVWARRQYRCPEGHMWHVSTRTTPPLLATCPECGRVSGTTQLWPVQKVIGRTLKALYKYAQEWQMRPASLDEMLEQGKEVGA